MAWTAPRTWLAAEVVTAAIMNTHVRDNLNATGVAQVTTAGDVLYATANKTLARLGATAAALLRWNDAGTALQAGPAVSAVTPWVIDLDAFMTSVSHVNWDTINIVAGRAYSGAKSSSGAQNDEINWDVVIADGTWTFELMHTTNSDAGIYSVQFDGVEKGTIDGYASPGVGNTRNSITGIVVATTAKVRVKIKMATKNASSSNYSGYIQHAQLRRTA